jgi:hypothetical protein
MAGHFDGSGVTDNHAVWAGFGLAAGFIFRANGWAEKSAETGKIVIHWTKFTSDVTSAAMIYLLALAIAGGWPILGYGPQPAAITGGTVVVLFLIGLRPLAENIQNLFNALIARIRGGAAS